MLVMAPVQQGQGCHHDNGKDACALTITTPLQQGQQRQLINSKDACTSMMEMLPGQQCQLNDYASLTTAEMLSSQGQQSPLQRRQRCLRINSKNSIAMRATTPS
jgi:hypothetical protein